MEYCDPSMYKNLDPSEALEWGKTFHQACPALIGCRRSKGEGGEEGEEEDEEEEGFDGDVGVGDGGVEQYEPDDDAQWYRDEVGEEPDEGGDWEGGLGGLGGLGGEETQLHRP